MATPIRMAPVLYGKEADFFYEQWAKMSEMPLKRPRTKEYMEEYKKFMTKQEYD